ncbi:porin family protein [bacterium]|nr:porin family protein [bacterium]MBU1994592.1 porin family protein [bacterium]
MKAVVFLLLFLSFLYADRDGGPYIGVGYGSSKYNDDGLYSQLKSDTSGSAVIYGGAYINKHLSVELGYVSFDAWHVQRGYETDTVQALGFGALSISTLAHYAFFDDVLDFYAKFGAGEMSMSGLSDNGFTMIIGTGVGVRFNEWLSMKVAYDMYNFNYDDESDVNNKMKYDMHIDYIYSAIEVQF